VILADDVLAAASAQTERDRLAGRPVWHLAERVRLARRFVFDPPAALAAWEVARARPSSMLSAMHLRRPPFPRTWIEYDYRALLRATGVEPSDDPARPSPARMGHLIEPFGAGHAVTLCWRHPWAALAPALAAAERLGTPYAGPTEADRLLQVCPVGMILLHAGEGDALDALYREFDDRTLADVREAGLGVLAAELGSSPRRRMTTLEEVRHHFRSGRAGERFRDLPEAEIVAAWKCERYWFLDIPPCFQEWGRRVSDRMAKHPELVPEIMEGLRELSAKARADVAGEPQLLTAMLILLNSRNAVEQEGADLTRLNRARERARKPPFLSHSTVRLSLSRVQRRRAEGAEATDRPVALHLVRGHFKLRKNRHGEANLFWWNDHLRGDPEVGAVVRDGYRVTP
jgi:hypothetical protein